MRAALQTCADCQKPKRNTVEVRGENVCQKCMDKRLEAYLDPTGTPAKTKAKPAGAALPTPYGKNPQGVKEAAVLSSLLKGLTQAGIMHRRINVMGMTTHGAGRKKSTQAGMPDVWAVDPDTMGRSWFIEVKKPDGRISHEQMDFMQEAHTFGCRVAVVASEDGVFRMLSDCFPVAQIEGWLPIW